MSSCSFFNGIGSSFAHSFNIVVIFTVAIDGESVDIIICGGFNSSNGGLAGL